VRRLVYSQTSIHPSIRASAAANRGSRTESNQTSNPVEFRTSEHCGNVSWFFVLARSFELEERENEKTKGFTQEKESDFQTL
jgi:hypothetical protein